MEKNNSIEVAYAATPEKQTLLTCTPTFPCTAKTAIELSGILHQYPEIDLSRQPIGIFGNKITLDTTIHSGDRIEIYRPLQIDPKKARKQRVS